MTRRLLCVQVRPVTNFAIIVTGDVEKALIIYNCLSPLFSFVWVCNKYHNIITFILHSLKRVLLLFFGHCLCCSYRDIEQDIVITFTEKNTTILIYV